MLNCFINDLFIKKFVLNPTEEQRDALQTIASFVLSKEEHSLLLLKGYAGTGKTSLVGAVVKSLTEMNLKTVLLAPTGRAAKVFSNYSGERASTIHKTIYRQKKVDGELSGFVSSNNLHKDTIFMVDEASMISNGGVESSVSFGSGQLLDDLIHYIYTGERCKLILMGDEAQLPPVGQAESPALNVGMLESYGLIVHEIRLTHVVRQSNDSGILYNATRLRDALRNGTVEIFPKLALASFKDFTKIGGEDLIEEISSCYAKDGVEDTMVICRSNKRANIYNNGIRNRIFCYESQLTQGDRLMVARNSYFWTNDCKEMDFIANGEIVTVKRFRHTVEQFDAHFADLTIEFQDYDLELDVRALLDTLETESPALPREQSEKLFHSILEGYADIPVRKDRMKKLKEDPFYNAIQIKYAYAVTCHKAQGGQWKNVFLDIGYMTEEMLGEDFYRWLYTAFTRATTRLYLVNLPKEFEDEAEK